MKPLTLKLFMQSHTRHMRSHPCTKHVLLCERKRAKEKKERERERQRYALKKGCVCVCSLHASLCFVLRLCVFCGS